MSSIAQKQSTKVRLFFGSEHDNFQLLSLGQNADAGIYFSAPFFQDIQWRLPSDGSDQQPVLVLHQVGEPGKLSIHRSGTVHAKAFGTAGTNEFAIRGNVLRSQDGKVLSVRHLLTILPSEPRHKPNSPPGARKTDSFMRTRQWHPYVIVFWAVPLNRFHTINVRGSFDADELEEVPPNGGWGAFNLSMHTVVWFAYRTKYMARWPRNTQACYGDGHAVPLFVGTGLGELRLEYRRPNYQLTDNQLEISF
jgi:hypothetical protein